VRVLILAYDFPPLPSVAALRPWSWFRYLPRFGVEPVVVTRQWANRFGDERDYVDRSATDEVEVERAGTALVIRTPYTPNLSNRLLLSAGADRYRLLRKAVTAGYEIAQYYAPVGPRRRLYQEARRYLAEHPVDAIVATGEPFVLFRYAAQLGREFGVPWVADYRDPWSQDKRRPGLQRAWETPVERRIVRTATLVTTAAEAFRRRLAKLFPTQRIEVVANGYDPDAVVAANGVEPGVDELTIALMGTISPWHPLDSVLRVLEEFVGAQRETPVVLNMIGISDRQAVEASVRARFPGLAGHVRFTPRVPNEQMVQELARAHVFLLFNNYAHAGTKVFDYLAVGRRILLCYADDPEAELLRRQHYNVDAEPGEDDRVLEHLVRETGSGTVVKDAAHLHAVLGQLAAELARTGRIDCRPVGVERYSRATQAGRLADLLRELPR
jgi:glycosyltransferase involved in cell wall biosynthesis